MVTFDRSYSHPSRSSAAWRTAALTLLLFVLAVAPGTAQTKGLDSLRRALPGTTGKARLDVLYALANALEGVIPREGLDYALEAIPLAEDLNDTASVATMYASASFSSSELGDIKEAMQYAYRSLELATLIGDKKRIASAHSTLGIALVYIGQFSKALEHHFEALRLREELGLTKGVAGTLNNIGIVYHRIGRYDESITYYKRSLERNGPNISPITKARLLTNIGYSEFKRGDMDAAMKYHAEARLLADKSHFITVLAYIDYNLGIIHEAMHKHAEALKDLNRALGYYGELKQKNGVLQVLNAMGQTYYALGSYAQARAYLERAVILGKQLNAPDQIKASYEILYAIYDKTGPESAAYRYLKLYAQAKDSLFNSVESKKIAEVSIQYATVAKEQEIQLLKKEKVIADLNLVNQKSQTRLVAGVIVLLFAVIVLMYVYLRSTKRSKQLVEEANASLKRLNIDLQEKIGEVKALSGLLPICASCKKIRDDKGYWEQLEGYISRHSDATFSHGICPDCIKELYPKYMKKKNDE